MTDNLHALEDWAAPLLARLSPGERRKLSQNLGRELRRDQQQRIADQQNPDGSAYAPRKPRKDLRGKAGRIKRRMFTKLRQNKHLRVQANANEVAIGFLGQVARIARVHQHGLRDRPERGQADVQYERRELLGFSDLTIDRIRDALLSHFDK